jgi:hypothetical protein
VPSCEDDTHHESATSGWSPASDHSAAGTFQSQYP